MSLDGISVVVVDDHPVFRDGMAAQLEAAGARVAGIAGDGEDAIAVVEREQPDVVIMDLNMPGLSGIEATRRITDMTPHVRVLVVTMHEDDDSLFSAMRAGAAGYLLKGATAGEITTALEHVAAGGLVLGPGIASRVRSYFDTTPGRQPHPFPELTTREQDVLSLVAAGLDNAAIAARLGIAHKTVKNHVSNIFTKLRVSDRSNAIIRARDAGLQA